MFNGPKVKVDFFHTEVCITFIDRRKIIFWPVNSIWKFIDIIIKQTLIVR